MIGSGTNHIRQKNQATVKVHLVGGEPFDAVVFLTFGDRLIDMLNDERNFIPVKKTDGSVVIVAKRQVISIVEADAVDPEEEVEREEVERQHARRRLNPYTLLRVEEDASMEEIRAAYRARLKAVHPDTLAGLDLDDEIAEAALKSTQRVTFAYRKIIRLRDAEMAEADAQMPESDIGEPSTNEADESDEASADKEREAV